MAVATIYGLKDPADGRVFYVGRTMQRRPSHRLANHVQDAYRSHVARPCAARIRAILERGERPIMEVLETVPLEQGAVAEQRWINELDGLLNVNPAYTFGESSRRRIDARLPQALLDRLDALAERRGGPSVVTRTKLLEEAAAMLLEREGL